jgi:hypothetical protein
MSPRTMPKCLGRFVCRVHLTFHVPENIVPCWSALSIHYRETCRFGGEDWVKQG